MRFFSRSMLRISNAAVMPTATPAGPALRSPRRRERGGVRQRFDARLELDERAELREARDAAAAAPARPRTCLGTLDHGSAGELLQPERDLLLVVVDAQDLDGDLLAGLRRPATCPTRGTSPSRTRGAGPARRRPGRRTRRTRAPRRRARSSPRRRRSSRRTSAALARCSSSSSARRETTRFLPPSLYSMIRNA